MPNLDYIDDDGTFGEPEKCATEGCNNTALLRKRWPHPRLCAECWEAEEAEEADRRADQMRERRIFGEG